MKKVLIALFGILLLAAGCTKESSQEQETDTSYFIKFKVGTEVKEYRDVVLAVRSTANGMHTISVQGQAALTGNPEGIVVGVSEPEPVVAGTYEETTLSDSPAMVFRDTAGKEFSTLFATSATGMTVTFSNISNTSARGTFSGRVTSLEGNELEITEGSFLAKFQ